MILAQIRSYLAAHRRAALTDMVYRFDVAPEALRGMLVILERKGKVRRLPYGSARPAGCSKCAVACDVAGIEVFEWIEPGAGQSPG